MRTAEPGRNNRTPGRTRTGGRYHRRPGASRRKSAAGRLAGRTGKTGDEWDTDPRSNCPDPLLRNGDMSFVKIQKMGSIRIVVMGGF